MRKSLDLRMCLLALAVLSLASSCRELEDARITEYRDGRRAAVSLTFDDGILDHYTMVAPHLDSLGLRATFWVNGNSIEQGEVNYAPRLTWQM